MENYNFLFNYNSYSFPIQIIKLTRSYFVYVGNSQFSFNNLTVAISDFENNKVSHTSSIFEDEQSELGKTLSDKLAAKFKCPIFLSFNIDDESLLMNRDVLINLEKGICDKITSILNYDKI